MCMYVAVKTTVFYIFLIICYSYTIYWLTDYVENCCGHVP